jgi:Beta-propeller repeat
MHARTSFACAPGTVGQPVGGVQRAFGLPPDDVSAGPPDGEARGHGPAPPGRDPEPPAPLVRAPPRQGECERCLRRKGQRLRGVSGAHRRQPVAPDPGAGPRASRGRFGPDGDPRVGVPRYAAVRYQGIYPGVDLVYHGANQRELEYDFVVAPGADPGAVRLGYAGAEGLVLDDAGSLILRTTGGDVLWRAPVAYQDIAGARRSVAAAYRIENGSEIRFRLGDYDSREPLVIDPVLSYSSYLGGSSVDQGSSVATDASGNAYVAGATCSPDFPTQDPFQGSNAGSCDAFVTKLSATGSLV